MEIKSSKNIKNMKKVDLIQQYIFSPISFFSNNEVQTKTIRIANVVLIASQCFYLLFFVAVAPTVVDLISSIFIESNMEFTRNFKYIIIGILIIVGSIQFISLILISLFIFHIFAIIFGGEGTLREFYINYIFAVAPPIAIKFFILTILSYIQGNNFILVFIELAQIPHKFLLYLILDPFFWWSSLLGCIALKESYKLTYFKAVIIMLTLLLIGITHVTVLNIF